MSKWDIISFSPPFFFSLLCCGFRLGDSIHINDLCCIHTRALFPSRYSVCALHTHRQLYPICPASHPRLTQHEPKRIANKLTFIIIFFVLHLHRPSFLYKRGRREVLHWQNAIRHLFLCRQDTRELMSQKRKRWSNQIICAAYKCHQQCDLFIASIPSLPFATFK